jgi:hypothetical protein
MFQQDQEILIFFKFCFRRRCYCHLENQIIVKVSTHPQKKCLGITELLKQHLTF